MSILNRAFTLLTDQWGRFRSASFISALTPTVGQGDDGFTWLDVGVEGSRAGPIFKYWSEPTQEWITVAAPPGDTTGMTFGDHTAIGDDAPHHAAVTLGGGSDAALGLSGQVLTLADVLTPTEHTAIGDASPHHARSHALDGTSDHSIGSLTNTYLVKSDGSKLVPATNTDAQVSAAVTASHAKQHAITATADHTSGATSGRMLKADANGLPIDATNTDAAVAAAVTASHAAVTLAADADTLLGLSTQALTLDTQAANTVFSGPTSGAAADPTFRTLDVADIFTKGTYGDTVTSASQAICQQFTSLASVSIGTQGENVLARYFAGIAIVAAHDGSNFKYGLFFCTHGNAPVLISGFGTTNAIDGGISTLNLYNYTTYHRLQNRTGVTLNNVVVIGLGRVWNANTAP